MREQQKIDKEEGIVRVAHLINVIGKEAQGLYEMFDLSEENQKDIAKVLEAFEARCVLVTNVIYERYMFNKRAQDAGESIDHFITDIIKLAEHCQYGELKDDLIRDKLVSGIQDDKVREKLLGVKDLNLEKTIETLRISQATKDMASHISDEPSATNTVNAVGQKVLKNKETRELAKDREHRGHTQKNVRNFTPSLKVCKYCGKKHEFKRGMCPAAEKKCKKCGKKGHFAKVFQSTKTVHAVEEELSEEETYAISTVKKSASTQALVTFQVNNQHNVTFEIDTGASCNILPFTEYVKGTGDQSGSDIKQGRHD